MLGRVRKLMIRSALVVMGLSSIAYAQPSPSGPVFCPFLDPFFDFLLTPIFVDLFVPGLGRDN